MDPVLLYDTTLRDGTQGEGVAFSVEDKLRITEKLDEFGIDYVEGGFPFSNDKDKEFFREAKKLPLKHTKIAAFGSTCRAKNRAEDDQGLKALLEAETPVVTLFGKAWDLHVTDILHTTLERNLEMVEDSVRVLKAGGREVVFDAEHFFDGFRANDEYALQVVEAAVRGGADVVVLCDTNGGSLPDQIREGVRAVVDRYDVQVGIHTHNDSNLAVANALVAVDEGARHVQGTINGLGERCGNADLCSVVANLVLKMKRKCVAGANLKKVTEVSRYVYERANMLLQNNQPFVGPSAFAHKGGVHADAIQKNPRAYEHIQPTEVGNERRILVSELSGSSAILSKLSKYGVTEREVVRVILQRVQERENEGYLYEAAEGSFELLALRELGQYRKFFDVVSFWVVVDQRESLTPVTEATVKVRIGDKEYHTASSGDGPVNALDGALRKALEEAFPQLHDMNLVDYKVRVINGKTGTAAKVRVVITSKDDKTHWGTVGVSENIIEASWEALLDSFEYKLHRDTLLTSPSE